MADLRVQLGDGGSTDGLDNGNPQLTTVTEIFENIGRDGTGYQLHVGFNDAGRRVIAHFTRHRDSRTWKPTIEQDIDIEAKYVDTATGIDPPTDIPPPPPPKDPV